MKALKKPLSLLMALLMCFGVFAGTGVTAFAAGETMTTYMVDIPRASDPNKAGWGHSDMSFLGGWSAQANDSFSVHTQDAYNTQHHQGIYRTDHDLRLAGQRRYFVEQHQSR